MKFEDIEPRPNKETRKTKMTYYNPASDEYVSYAQAMNLKKKGINLFLNNTKTQSEDLTSVLEEKIRCTNILLGALDKILND